MSGEGLGAFSENGFVESDQGLQRCVRAHPPDTGKITIRRIKYLQHGVGSRAAAKSIERATIPIRSGLLLVREGRITGRRLEYEVGRRRENRRTAELRVEQTTGGERDVAHNLGVGAEARPASEQAIVWVTGVDFLREPGGLPISCRCDDQPMHVL